MKVKILADFANPITAPKRPTTFVLAVPRNIGNGKVGPFPELHLPLILENSVLSGTTRSGRASWHMNQVT
ncbi:hypothetical protein N9985_02495 [Gammaproteobacteria bacterium]|nr:hypothetical protein [Gammaproteobacteria bacterium]